MKKTTLIQISTTNWEEENFFLVTDLNQDEIIETINPIVNMERDGYEEYTNESLFNDLKKRFPKAILIFYPINKIDLISI